MSGEVSGFNHEGHEGPRRKPLRIQPLCNFVSLVVHEIRTELSALTSSSLCKYRERAGFPLQIQSLEAWARIYSIFQKSSLERKRSEEHTSELQSRQYLVC